MSRSRPLRPSPLSLARSVALAGALAFLVSACGGGGGSGAADSGGGPPQADAAAPADTGGGAPRDTAAADLPGPAPDASAPPADAPGGDLAGLPDGSAGPDAGGCPPFAAPSGGACVCIEGYVDADPTPDGTQCVVRCSELSVEGLNGWCPAGQICTQGECVVDACEGVDCPEHASCVVRRDEGVCLCAEPYHRSADLCCGPNESSEGGACRCDPGYEPGGGVGCVPTADNPCLAAPCDGEDPHRRTCVPVDGAPGFRCDCDAGYVLDAESGRCLLERQDECPAPLLCRSGYCVPADRSREQCLVDADCRVFEPTAPTTCNPEASGGICLGCRYHSDCPGSAQCNDFGACANLCDDDDDCPYGRCYNAVGLCGQVRCQTDEDCFGGTVCVDADGSGSGQCHRIACVESECSEFHPTGACPTPGEACVYGVCLSGCAPNPCDQEPNRTVCEQTPAGPICRCAPGFVEGPDRACAPAPTAGCGSGFTCEGGFCVDRSDAGFQCATDADCGAIECSSPATLPSGKCTGCTTGADCPRADTCLAGYCLRSCASAADCNAAMVCTPQGYCGTRSCGGPTDCPNGYTCSGTGSCVRRPCTP